MKKRIMGVDVGFSGALALYDGKEFVYKKMPIIKSTKNEIDEQALREMITQAKPTHVFIEKAQSMPKQGVSSTFRYGMSYGIVKGMLSALKIPYTAVTPQAWKNSLMTAMGRDKGASVLRMKQLFPDVKLSKTEHGIADAMLIAYYGWSWR